MKEKESFIFHYKDTWIDEHGHQYNTDIVGEAFLYTVQNDCIG